MVMTFRDQLAHDLIPAGYSPVEHRTIEGRTYMMYVLPDRDPELPYTFDPTCGDCGCPRTACFGPPPFGWDDLVPESGCDHYDDGLRTYQCN